MKNDFDFGGTATLYGVRCDDGVTLYHSFDDQDGKRVPLVWQHDHRNPENVLGHAILSKRDNGIYCYCKFNDSDKAQSAKEAVKNGDIDSLSIFADKLQKDGNIVNHGIIREVSLVFAGANPGAKIDYVKHAIDTDGVNYLAHAETYEDSDSSILIHSGEQIELFENDEYDKDYFNENSKEEKTIMEDNKNITMTSEDLNDVIQHAVGAALDAKEASDNETVEEVLKTLTPKQRNAVNLLVGSIAEEFENNSVQHSDMEEDMNDEPDDDEEAEEYEDVNPEDYTDEEDIEDEEEVEHSSINLGGNEDMYENVFDQNGYDNNDAIIMHSTIENETLRLFQEDKVNFKQALDRTLKSEAGQDYLAHAAATGITNISNLFPEPKLVGDTPFIIKKDAEWVEDIFKDVSKQSFGRIKSVAYDTTQEAARAKGYIKGNLKVDQQFAALKRITTPTVVYSKATLDKQDILEITDFNVIAIMKQGLDVTLRYEIARQFLISDGRASTSPDKINDENIRPIHSDNELYTIRKVVTLADSASGKQTVDVIRPAVLDARRMYKGSGSLKCYAPATVINSMLLAQDTTGRDLYDSEDKLATALRVKKIVEVPEMESATYTDTDANKTYKILAIFVNMRDYVMGAVKGGETSSYEQFDIDYNQMKYLTETFCSGALVVPKSAIVIMSEVTTSNPTG